MMKKSSRSNATIATPQVLLFLLWQCSNLTGIAAAGGIDSARELLQRAAEEPQETRHVRLQSPKPAADIGQQFLQQQQTSRALLQQQQKKRQERIQAAAGIRKKSRNARFNQQEQNGRRLSAKSSKAGSGGNTYTTYQANSKSDKASQKHYTPTYHPPVPRYVPPPPPPPPPSHPVPVPPKVPVPVHYAMKSTKTGGGGNAKSTKNTHYKIVVPHQTYTFPTPSGSHVPPPVPTANVQVPPPQYQAYYDKQYKTAKSKGKGFSKGNGNGGGYGNGKGVIIGKGVDGKGVIVAKGVEGKGVIVGKGAADSEDGFLNGFPGKGKGKGKGYEVTKGYQTSSGKKGFWVYYKKKETDAPTTGEIPTVAPTFNPTLAPVTASPTVAPATAAPQTAGPTLAPVTDQPSLQPTTPAPVPPGATPQPTDTPTITPTTATPTSASPTTAQPTTDQPTGPVNQRCDSWLQIGQDIDGEGEVNFSGASLAVSADARTIIVGEYLAGDMTQGQARVWTYDEDQDLWFQVASTISGDNEDDNTGFGVAITPDGDDVIVGSPEFDVGNNRDDGRAQIFQLQADWTQIGSDILGEAEDDFFGNSVAIRDDAQFITIGARSNTNPAGETDAGHVRTFEFSSDSGEWEPVANELNGAGDDLFGTSVNMTPDGETLMVGAAGYIRVYDLEAGQWVQVGNDIVRTAGGDQNGNSESISDDGQTIAIGAPSFDSGSGQVRMLEFDEDLGDWVQKGSSLETDLSTAFLGEAVSLSADGNVVLVGSPTANNQQGFASVFQFENGDWEQVADDIPGEFEGDFFGQAVGISDDGQTIAIGAPENDDGGNLGDLTGHTRVFVCGFNATQP
eukprot:CAMPEP_0172456634 /NCGR_PEP_ID=MMETSP1065-20121228/16824_1 /TAXON_ID=265537 /ORGANISM="Amphiprora paludosa, Strain CCMP125" /LENGTH=844 /DNA_ID=CAMNT_0013209787 /DNA_START=59 /DNA_END=2593 /DNA_ORIENTATION=+